MPKNVMCYDCHKELPNREAVHAELQLRTGDRNRTQLIVQRIASFCYSCASERARDGIKIRMEERDDKRNQG